MQKPYDLTIIVPCTKPLRWQKRLVESVKLQNLSCLEIELLLVGSNHGVCPTRHGQIAIKTVKHQSRSANVLRNFGARTAYSDLLFFVDDDCQFSDSDLILKWWTWFKDHPHYSIAGGAYQSHDSAGYWDRTYNDITSAWLNSEGGLVGGHLLVRKELLEKIPFDESIKYGGTESNWLSRAEEDDHHWKFLDNMQLLHRPECHALSFSKKAFLQGRAKTRHRRRANLLKAFQQQQGHRNWPGFALFANLSLLGWASSSLPGCPFQSGQQ